MKTPFNEKLGKAFLKVMSLAELAEVYPLDEEELAREVKNCLRNAEFCSTWIKALKDRSVEFRCSYTKRMMKVPVVASDGKFYDEAFILGWIRSNPNSPITGTQLSETAQSPTFVRIEEAATKAKIFCQLCLEDFSQNMNVLLSHMTLVATVQELLAEFLGVLDVTQDSASFLKVFAALEGLSLETIFRCCRQFGSSGDFFDRLEALLREHSANFPSTLLELSLIKVRLNIEASNVDSAITTLRSLLEGSKADCKTGEKLSPGLLRKLETLTDLAIDVGKICNAPQLEQLASTLAIYLPEFSLACRSLQVLRARLLMREGRKTDAIQIITALQEGPSDPNTDLLTTEFCLEFDMKQQRAAYLEGQIKAELTALAPIINPTQLSFMSHVMQLFKLSETPKEQASVDLAPLSNQLKEQDSRILELSHQLQQEKLQGEASLARLAKCEENSAIEKRLSLELQTQIANMIREINQKINDLAGKIQQVATVKPQAVDTSTARQAIEDYRQNAIDQLRAESDRLKNITEARLNQIIADFERQREERWRERHEGRRGPHHGDPHHGGHFRGMIRKPP